MKDKIFLVIIGVLVGAVISTGIFFTYTIINNSKNCNNHNTQMNGGTPPSMPNQNNNGNNNSNSNNNQPPEMPNGDNNQNNQESNNNNA